MDQKLTDGQIALKAAVRHAVRLAGGPVAASEFTRVDPARLSRYGNPSDPMFAPIDVAADLDLASGDDVILRAWANLRGYELTPREAETVLGDLRHSAGTLARETGALVSDAVDALADGALTPHEATRLDDQAAKAERTILDIRSQVRRAGKGSVR